MTSKISKPTSKTPTGPLAIADLGRFGFKDGVWYLEPKAAPTPTAKR